MHGARGVAAGRGSLSVAVSAKMRPFAACLALWLAPGCAEEHEATTGQSEPGTDSDAIADDAGGVGEAAPADGCAGLPEVVRRRWLAFDSNRERENRDLYMMRGDGSERMRLTQGAGEEREPAFSPDGTRLAYVSEHDGVALIYVYDFRSGEVRQISRSPAQVGRADWFAHAPAWFPDGTRLAFHRGGELLVIDADGAGDERTLAAGEDYVDGYRNAAVTPDGREVLCDRWHEIVAVDVQTGARRQIVARRAVTIEAPSLSPDGSQFAYSVVCVENFLQITLAATSGDGPKPCKTPLISASGGSRATNPAWGPGDYIAYESDPDEGPLASSITLVKRGGTPCVFDRAGAHEAHPAWAPADFALPDGFSPF